MTTNEIGEWTGRGGRKESGRVWIVRDRGGRRVLGTARSLRAAIIQAAKRGERFPLLEQAPGPDDDSVGPALWRRTL